MTTKGKPSADPYLMGSESLSIPPEQCIVVENAPLGIQAAKAYCIAICSILESLYLQEADLVVDSFEELHSLSVIGSLLGDYHN